MRQLTIVCMTCLCAACSTGNRSKDIGTDTTLGGEDTMAIEQCASAIQIVNQGTAYTMEIKQDPPILNLEVDDPKETWMTDRGEPAQEKWKAFVRLKVVSDEFKGLSDDIISASFPTLRAEISDSAANIILTPLTLNESESRRLYRMLSKGNEAEDEFCFTLYTDKAAEGGRDKAFDASHMIRITPRIDY